MENLVNTELFGLLAESSQGVSNEEMGNAYETFVKKVETFNRSEADYSIIYRRLNLTRIEFISLQTYSEYEQGKKCV